MDEDQLERWAAEAEQMEAQKRAYSQAMEHKSHPIIHKLVEQIAKSPRAYKSVERAANFLEYPGAFAGGAVQTVGDMGASLANLGLKPINKAFGTQYHVPHPNIREHFPEGFGNDVAFTAGELAGGLAGGFGAGTGRGVVQGLQKLARPQGYSGLLSDVAKGAGAGYALGETNEGDRTIGAILGGIAQPLSSITNKGIANRIISDAEKAASAHGRAYEKILGKNAPYSKSFQMNLPDAEQKKIFESLQERLPKDYRTALETYLKEPTIRNAHELQSTLYKWMKPIENSQKYKTNSLPPRLQTAYESAKEARDFIKKDISHSLAKNGFIEESMMYPIVTESYAKNVAPYFTKEISDVKALKKFPEKLPERLRSNEEFMLEMAKKYPELGLNQFFNKLKPYGIGAGIGAAGALGIPRIARGQEPFMETENYEIY